MPILVFDEPDPPKQLKRIGLKRILTEVDDRGVILREMGLDADDRVLYLAPAHVGKYRYGFFDLQTIDPQGGLENEFPEARFEELWNAAASEFQPRSDRTVSGPLRASLNHSRRG